MPRSSQSTRAGRQSESGAATRQVQTTRSATQRADRRHDGGVTVTIPQPVVDVATAPFVIVGRVLPAKRGLPVYIGLGVLAAVDAVAWPVAAGIGVAYAAIRHWGPQARPPDARRRTSR